MSWRFKGNTPLSIKVVFALVAVNFLGQLAASFVIPRISPITADAAHSYFVRFKGAAGYYVTPWLGMYFDYGFWTHFVLLAAFFLMVWVHRDQIERIR
jgi:FtsH-binding integral membrane protein